MKLYVIRHAKAASYLDFSSDYERPLVARGIEQSKAIGRFFKEEGHKIELVLTSPVLRAKQTAEYLCESMGDDAPIMTSWLACGMRPEEALSELAAYAELESVAIVGHEPDLSYLICKMLDCVEPPHKVKKASVTVLGNIDRVGFSAQLEHYFIF